MINALNTVIARDVNPFPTPWNTIADIIPAGMARRKKHNIFKTLEIIGAREALWSEYANRRAI